MVEIPFPERRSVMRAAVNAGAMDQFDDLPAIAAPFRFWRWDETHPWAR